MSTSADTYSIGPAPTWWYYSPYCPTCAGTCCGHDGPAPDPAARGEREACARLCDDAGRPDLATAIRARG